MSKTLLIIQREFATRVKKKSFIILTILIPFILAALVFVPIWLSTFEEEGKKAIAIFDSTTNYLAEFKDNNQYHFVPIIDPDNPSYYSDTTRYEAVIVINDDLIRNPQAATIYSSKQVQVGLLTYVQNILNERVRCEKLANTGIQGIEKIIDDIQSEITISTIIRHSEGGEETSNSDFAIAVGFIFTFLIYIFVMSYGGMVMQSVMEEKTNRIVELMISSVKPFQLMMGKIIGIALVGFVQLAIWGIMLFTILFVANTFLGIDATATQVAMTNMNELNTASATIASQSETHEILSYITNLPLGEITLLFILYFIGGYLLYASFFAAVGASVNEQEDSSQFMMPVIFIMIFGLYAAMGSMENTNGPLAFWTSMFPLTSPIVMMVRLPFSVPLWQELLSLLILYATALLFVWISGRIYRVGILMYGKKPSLKEMAKWLKYK